MKLSDPGLTWVVAEHTLVWSSYNYEVVEQEVEGVVGSSHEGALAEVQVDQLLEEACVQVVRENVEGTPETKTSELQDKYYSS